MTRILIVDDDPNQLRLLEGLVAHAGYVPVTVSDGTEALAVMRRDPNLAAVLLDLVMPDLDGLGVLERMRRDGLSQPVIALTSGSASEAAGTALKCGAVDFITRPITPERLAASVANVIRIAQLEAAIRVGENRRGAAQTLADIVGRSPESVRIQALASKAARTSQPVLLEGEAGTGKTLLARAIHAMSDRAGKPFIAINCSSLAHEDQPNMLFGNGDTGGKLGEAAGGTVLLTQIGALSDTMQSLVLQMIQHGEVTLPQRGRAQKCNVRVIAATSQRLLNLAKAGVLREDLFYRLNVHPIYLSPLRDRRVDIAPLANRLVARLGAEAGKRIVGISRAAQDLLERYDWPGNIAEFESVLYRAILLAEHPELDIADFPKLLVALDGRARLAGTAAASPPPVHIDNAPLTQFRHAPQVRDRFLTPDGSLAQLTDIERDLILFAIAHHKGRMARVARSLGIGRSTLYRKLHEYGLVELGAEAAAA